MQQAAMRYRIKGTNRYVPPLTASMDMVTPSAVPSTPYEAASQNYRLARWQPSGSSPNSILSYSLPTLRNRSRERRRNDGLADAGVEILVSNIVSTGIKPQFQTPDAGLNRALAALWLRWTDESDAEGLFDFYGQQALMCGSMITSGDSFARLRARLPEDGLSVPLQIQMLASEYCPVDFNESSGTGSYIVNGVQFSPIQKREAYWLYKYHPNDSLTRFSNNDLVKVPANEVVHLANTKDIGVVRGEPWLARALVKLQEIDKYDDAQVTRQQIAALFAGFVRPAENGFLGGLSTPNAEGKALAPLEPGLMQPLGAGEEIQWSDPPDAGPTYEPFVRAQHSHIAASIGLLYEQLTGDYRGVNDRTWRAALNEFGTRLGRWQHHIIVFQFCRPVVRRWLEYAVLSNAIALPRTISLNDVLVKWLPPPRPYLHPEQDIRARNMEIRSGLKSRSESVSERGFDSEVVDDEIARDNARADAKGLIYDSDARKTAGTGAVQSDNEPSFGGSVP